MAETSYSFLDSLKHQPDSGAWEQLATLYTPLFHSWLRRYDVLSPVDVDDLVQEVLLTVLERIPNFEYNNHPGAFRSWLRAILVNRLRKFWEQRRNRPVAFGGSDFLNKLDELEDQSSHISGIWDREHDQHVIRSLLSTIQPRFTDRTWQAFQKLVLENTSAEKVAADLNMSLNAIYTAKSRVMKELRQEAGDMIA